MRRLFSGNKSGSSSPTVDQRSFDNRTRSNSNLNSSNNNSNNNGGGGGPTSTVNGEEISPELAPIVTLLSAQSHRRYHEGVFMFLQSINSDGESIPNRTWREVYGVLLGTQLAVWDIEELEKHQNNTEALLNASSKPDYINFTDSSFRAVKKLENSQGLNNVIIVSTTLKNQFLLQYPDIEDFHKWNSAFRLSTFEYTSLQEAYTGALLSARGSKLSDIRTILTNTKFDYEDWVSVRFGSGMPWKRCFAVIEQPTKKSKGSKIYKGNVSFYKDEKKNKKQAMAFIKDASAAYALYPTSVKMIDHSTMIKLEGTVYFDNSKKSLPKEASIYFMPEQHSAVPGYDTLIRFLIPLLNTFNLYGRPKRLNADKSDMYSLLFGLPVLPHVHYLEVDDLILLASNSLSETWLVTDWRIKIKEILERKLRSGYTGCGSSHGIVGAINSPALNSNDFADVRSINSGRNFSNGNNMKRVMSPLTPSFIPEPKFRDNTPGSRVSSLNVESPEDLETSPLPGPNINRNSEITQIYEDYSGIVQANQTYQNSITGQQQSRSPEKNSSLIGVVGATTAAGAAIGAGTAAATVGSIGTSPQKNPSPYNTALASGLNEGYNSNSASKDSFQRSNYSDAKSVPSRKILDDEFDEDFDNDEIFNNGISGLAINSKKPSTKDVDLFNPDYSSKDSKPLDPPIIRVEQASPYTSGRISQSTFDNPSTVPPPSNDINPYQTSPSKSKPLPEPQQQQVQQQQPSLQIQSNSSNPYQDYQTQQRTNPVPAAAPQGYKPSGPRPQQAYQDPPQQQQRPPQQQYGSQQSYPPQNAPDAQFRKQGPPPQQQQNYNQQQRPPQQYQQTDPSYQRQGPPQGQGQYGYSQPVGQQRQGPPPGQQRQGPPPGQQRQGPPPGQQRQGPPPGQRSYPPQGPPGGPGGPGPQGQRPPQGYSRQPPPHQQSQQRQNYPPSNQQQQQQYPPSNQYQQQQQQQYPAGKQGYAPPPPQQQQQGYAANSQYPPAGPQGQYGSSNPYSQGNPYSR